MLRKAEKNATKARFILKGLVQGEKNEQKGERF